MAFGYLEPVASEKLPMRFNPTCTRLLPFLLALVCVALWGCSATAQPTQVENYGLKFIPPGFEQVVQQLKQVITVPLVLPTKIPTDALVPVEGKPQPYLGVPLTESGKFKGVYPYVLMATPTRYELSLDTEPDCRGAGACSFGLVSGEKLTPTTPTVQEEYAYQTEDPRYNPIARSPEKQGGISLAKGIKGYFVPYVCGANCDTSKMFWEQNGYRYMVGIRYASQKTMREMANSAIENQKRFTK